MDTYGETSSRLLLFVNGKRTSTENVNPTRTLLWFLREELRLTGSKLSCGQGGCGACTVMMSEVDRKTSKLHHYTVNACIYPLVCTHGKAVTTVEGIGSTRTVLHPVQERLAKCHGTQCGFCSPGMVMSMYTLLRNTPKPTVEQIEEAIQGNLCRCTGYRPILDSFKTFVNDELCSLGENCCKNTKNRCTETNFKAEELLYDISSFKPLSEVQEIIFPSELQISNVLDNESLQFRSNHKNWYRPSSLDEAIKLMRSVPNSAWAMGHVQINQEKSTISVGHLPELNGICLSEDFLEIGSGTTLAALQKYLSCTQSVEENHKTTYDSLLSTFTNWVSGCQIKNVGTVGGNLMIGSRTSNFIPMLMVLNAEAIFKDGSEEIKTKINNSFYPHAQKNSSLLLLKIRIPLIQDYFIGYYYASQQSHLGGRSSIVSAAYKAKVNNNRQITSLSCAFGGINDRPVVYDNIIEESMLHGDKLIDQYIQLIKAKAKTKEGTYEMRVVLNLFGKFHSDLQEALQKHLNSGFVTPYNKSLSARSIYVWEPQSDRKSVGQPIPTQWAMEHVSGEAKYVMDLPKFKDELHMALVTSTKSHANILSIDATKALDIPGVVDFVEHTDIPVSNRITFTADEEVFASKKVTHFGQFIGGILATTSEIAAAAAKAVVVTYEELPAILNIKEAIEKQSFMFPVDIRKHGDVEEGFKNCPCVLSGEFGIAGQEHYYMETHAAVVVPKQEDNQYDIYGGAQTINTVQKSVSMALGIPFHKINVHVRRIGGAFGGKEFRGPVTPVPASVAAHKHNKPVRLVLDRATDMTVTGNSHPFYAKYKVGCDTDGSIVGLYCDFYVDGGDSTDASGEILGHAVAQLDNTCKVPNLHVNAYACKTNLSCNTSFRGFGTQLSTMLMNVCVDKIAKELNKDRDKVYEINFYQDGDLTITNQVMENCNIKKCWDLLKNTCDYFERKHDITEFNRINKNKKKGIALTPVKLSSTFGGIKFLNQGAALVNIYTDGSVLVHHGGIEMGQGLNIKVLQIASESLGIHHSKVIIDETNTNSVPNTVPTASSSGTDLHGGAVKNACDKLNERLRPLKDRNPKATWDELVSIAFFERVPLSATGYYKQSGITYDLKTKQGNICPYFTFGAACSEIELDILTGEHKLLQTDIAFDIGKSINPAIDIGQIEGGFVQGYGFYCIEELQYSTDGQLLTTGPSTYRVPTVRDIPHKLNVTLLKDHPNEKAVYSSKGIGEPPLLLASSVYFAITDAITSVRLDNGLSQDFQLNCPTSPKMVLQACSC